ncbi:nickel-dependent hydrogenases large subunit signature 2 [Lucifera butyrica]|uniref:Nickel-dependent hydrogenases large subunit signature 2 n=1 Tax=Lucifera butyrica TaxID=1351585 RepID=A0A498R6I5_9FIRM|nr:nickel-dependent hydrogenase large subunit [Lucifera butyrica]VBB06809.1 nickel-dependent hydrogenases large subunit signature 2 [Lucifera butyrica]
MKRIVIDPMNRIEGHLRVEVTLDEASGKVNDALSSGTAWRGIELVLKDRDPRDAWAFAQRICGVCTTMHALASLRAVEDALGIEIPNNANYIRNIIAASQEVHDHLMHFYHLHALDWVSPLEAAKADPAATAALQNAVLEKYDLGIGRMSEHEMSAYPKEYPKATTTYFAAVKTKIQQIVDNGQLGIFAAHYWDHPDYRLLPPEVHLMAVAHYLNMLDKQREVVVPHVVFGGKNPHPHYVLGGMPCSVSMTDMNAPINSERLAVVETSLDLGIALTKYFYMPDALAIGHMYVQKGMLDGGGLAGVRVLGFGDYPDEAYSGIKNGDFHKKLLFRCNGVVENFSLGVEKAVYYDLTDHDLTDPAALTEGVEHSWYNYPQGQPDLHPWQGITEPNFTGPGEGTATAWKQLNEAGKYSWLKTPKWRGKAAEVGPLARYIIVYTKVKQGHIQPTWAEKMIVEQVDAASKVLGLPPEKWLVSTVGRTLARGLEAQLFAYMSKYYFDKLIANLRNGDTHVANTSLWDPASWPQEAKGVGLHEAPRGALSHWVVIKNGKIDNYQAVVPSTWNACPRDSTSGHGPYEASMMDTLVKTPDKPLEILRVIHSFDPCLACATHLYNREGQKLAIVETDAYAGI